MDECFLTSTIDNFPYIAWIKDIQGRFIHVNDHYLSCVDKKYEDVIGHTDYDVFSKQEAELYEKHDIDIIESKKKKIFIDFRNKRWYETQKSPVIDDQNNVVGITGFMRDITHEKELDETLKDDKSLLQLLLDNIPYTIYFKDKDSRFIKINKAQAEVLGLDHPIDAIGKTDFDFFTLDHAKLAYEDEKNIVKTGKPLIKKVERIRHSDGTFKWVTTTKMPIRNHRNEIFGTVGITIDITEKMEAEIKLKEAKEKAEESDRLKTAFLANMSHEIRTPMNGIIGFTNLLKEPSLNEESKNEYLEYINNCGKTLLNLIDDIIDISKIEAGQLNLNVSDCLVNVALKELKSTLLELLKLENKKNIEVLLNMENSDPSFTIVTDPYRFKQVMNNLLNNAAKFTPKGSIEFGYVLESDNMIDFYVKDTGIGIPVEKQKTIFERFGQVINSNFTNQKGTGLGLAISKHLSVLLGGKLWVESEINKGSVFYFRIPRNYHEQELPQ